MLNRRYDGTLFFLICSYCNYGLYTPAKKIIYLMLSISIAFSPINSRYYLQLVTKHSKDVSGTACKIFKIHLTYDFYKIHYLYSYESSS